MSLEHFKMVFCYKIWDYGKVNCSLCNDFRVFLVSLGLLAVFYLVYVFIGMFKLNAFKIWMCFVKANSWYAK